MASACFYRVASFAGSPLLSSLSSLLSPALLSLLSSRLLPFSLHVASRLEWLTPRDDPTLPNLPTCHLFDRAVSLEIILLGIEPVRLTKEMIQPCLIYLHALSLVAP